MSGIIKEALEYVVNMHQPKIIEHAGWSFATDKDVERMDMCLRANSLTMSTLSGLVGYIKSNTDKMAEKMIVHVVSPTEVHLLSMLNDDRKRECLVKVVADIPEFQYGRFMDAESFLISIRSKFIQNEGAENLLKFAGTVEVGTLAKYGDDGISQKATIKKGISGREDALVPNPVKLRPFRTFTEVEQPESEFVFRMKDFDGSITCALFEADGGAWKRAAMKNIMEHLQYELANLDQFTVIS